MATTTNYGWTTPDDTSLVKDGAAAIRTLGSSVDTTTKTLNPSTTLGDIEYRSSTANTNTRLGIGTTGQVLTVAGGVPTWATASGGMTLLSTTTLSGASTTVTVSSTGYIRLQVDITGVTNATADGAFYLKPNNESNLSFYTGVRNILNTPAMLNYRADLIALSDGALVKRTDAANRWTVILDYPDDTYHTMQLYGKFTNDGSNNVEMNFMGATMNTAITSLVFNNTGGNFSTGTVKVYGVK